MGETDLPGWTSRVRTRPDFAFRQRLPTTIRMGMSARTELARLVLQVLSSGDPVSTQDALQLRSWALTPDDAILSLEAVALLILSQEENRKPTSV